MQRHSQKQILERYFSNNVMLGSENSVKNPNLQVQKIFYNFKCIFGALTQFSWPLLYCKYEEIFVIVYKHINV